MCTRYGYKYVYRKIKDGSIIKVSYDPAKGRISFCVDDRNQGVAFDLLAKGMTLYPIVELGNPGAHVEML